MKHSHLGKGILAGISAGVFWGTPFLVPMILSDFTAFEITFGRFFFFGLVSLLFLPRVVRLCKQLSRIDLLKVFGLSATGFWLYSLVLFYGVQLTDGVIAALIVGCLPLTIILFSKPHFNIQLYLGLGLISFGLLCLIALPLFKTDLHFLEVSLIGLAFVFAALFMWTHFGIKNSRFMASHQKIQALDYSSLIGLCNLICVIPLFAISHNFSSLFAHSHFASYLFWCAVLGLGASWIANIFWAYSAKICPPSIGGSLIVSETIFGLIYSFLFEKRLPHFNEVIAIAALVLGVILSIHSQSKFHHGETIN